MEKIKLIYDLSYLPESPVGHLIPTPEVVGSLREIGSKHNIKKILEIGFNTGWSSTILFKTFKDITVTSIEINKSFNAIEASKLINLKFNNFLTIIWEDSFKVYETLKKNQNLLPESNYDTSFIDGDHGYEAVKNDINLCMYLGIKNIIFDDSLNPNVLRAIREEKKLELVKNYPYPNIRKRNNRYFLKSYKGYQTALSHYHVIS